MNVYCDLNLFIGIFNLLNLSDSSNTRAVDSSFYFDKKLMLHKKNELRAESDSWELAYQKTRMSIF